MSLTTLTRFERRQLHALFDRLLPSGDPALPIGATDVDAAGHFEQQLPWFALRSVLGMRLALWVLAFAPLWRLGRPRTFASLPAADGIALLERFYGSPWYLLRQMVFLMREMACMGYGTDPRVHRAIAQASTPDEGAFSA